MTEQTIEAGGAVRIRSDNPVLTASAEKLEVLAIGTSIVTHDRRWALVENEWGIVQAMDVAALEPWPADAE